MEVSSGVDALRNMSSTLDAELRSLLAYFGEDPNSPEAPKPEDFFGLIASFSSSLQVSQVIFDMIADNYLISFAQKCALEVHDAQQSLDASKPKAPDIIVKEEVQEDVSNVIKHMVFVLLLKPPHRQSRPHPPKQRRPRHSSL